MIQLTVQLLDTTCILNPHGKKTTPALVSPWCHGPPATGTAVTPKALAAPSPKLRDLDATPQRDKCRAVLRCATPGP